MKIKILALLVGSLSLSACGSGGGGGSADTPTETDTEVATSSSSVADTQDPVVVPDDTPAEPAPTIEEVDADVDFEFKSDNQYSVSIAMSADDKHFISICKPNDQGGYSMTDCIFSGFVQMDTFNKEFTVANDIDELSVSVWNPNVDDAPDEYVWSLRDSNTMSIVY